MIARFSTRSTSPLKPPSIPTGRYSTAGRAPRRSLIMPTHISKFAPVRSSLLTKHMRGTLYFSAWRHTVSDCGSTPADRKSVVSGKGGSVRVDLGGRRNIKKKKKANNLSVAKTDNFKIYRNL